MPSQSGRHGTRRPQQTKADMTLSEALRDLEAFSDKDTNTIYAQRPWSAASPAFVAEQPPHGRLPESASAGGFSYFLEVFIARDFLRDWPGSFDAFATASSTSPSMMLRLVPRPWLGTAVKEASAANPFDFSPSRPRTARPWPWHRAHTNNKCGQEGFRWTAAEGLGVRPRARCRGCRALPRRRCSVTGWNCCPRASRSSSASSTLPAGIGSAGCTGRLLDWAFGCGAGRRWPIGIRSTRRRGRLFRFFTAPPVTVFMPDEPPETSYGQTMFRRVQDVLAAGGFCPPRPWVAETPMPRPGLGTLEVSRRSTKPGLASMPATLEKHPPRCGLGSGVLCRRTSSVDAPDAVPTALRRHVKARGLVLGPGTSGRHPSLL